jgi:hypothetical protein
LLGAGFSCSWDYRCELLGSSVKHLSLLPSIVHTGMVIYYCHLLLTSISVRLCIALH